MRWVFLDLDGTLANTLGALRAAYRSFLQGHAVVGSDEEFASLNGCALPEIVDRLQSRHRLRPAPAVLLAQYRALIERVYRTSIEPCPGADELLTALAVDGHPLALVTAAPCSAAAAAISKLGWTNRFAVRVCGDEVARAKPAPDIYHLALQRAGCRSQDAVAVEDSRNGVQAARSAGLTVLAVHGAQSDAPGAHALPDLASALAWLRGRR